MRIEGGHPHPRELPLQGSRAEALEQVRDLVLLSGSPGDGEALRETWREIADLVSGRTPEKPSGKPATGSGKGRPRGK